jgi:catechol 2,3-dioxygenase-like lactoylglutathione lyase family enzyme
LSGVALGETVTALRPFVPCDDFELCKRFYADLGFTLGHHDDAIAIFASGAFSFVLQNYRWESARQNYVLQLLVSDVDAWWARIQSSGLAARYGVRVVPVKDEPWGATGARVIHLIDPTGILWHITQFNA